MSLEPVSGAIKDARAEALASITATVVPNGYFTDVAPFVPLASTYCSSRTGSACSTCGLWPLLLGCAGERLVSVDESCQVTPISGAEYQVSAHHGVNQSGDEQV